MHKLKHLSIIILILLLFTGIIEAENILSVDQIRPGMVGVGKTVFKGRKVEEFPVEVIDILKSSGIDSDLILIKTGGKQIDKIGGIAAGMSGSPVYIDDKLIGAIGYGWQFSDHHYGLVTPIKEMLKLFEEGGEEQKLSDNLAELKTPLMVSGLKGRAFNKLKDELAQYELEVKPGSGVRDAGDSGELEPGSAVAVQLARGDVNIASIGTVTYLEDNKLLAFGHPFTNKGRVSYLLSEAYISGIIPSLEQPFKLGSPSNKLLGMIDTDRGAGISGELGNFPEIIPLRVIVNDRDREIKKEVMVQIVKDEVLFTTIGTNIALQSIDSTLDRIGRGTAWVKLKVMGSGLPDFEVEKENMFYSQQDIGSMALADFYQLLYLINSNPYKKINIFDVQLNVEVSTADNVALVQKAEVLNKEIKPGDTLEIEITLHPYRQETFKQKVTLQLPDDIQPGLTSLVIDGGFTGQTGQPAEENQYENFETNQAQVEGYTDFTSLIEDYLEQPENNDLIIQVYPGYPVAGMVETGESVDEQSGETAEADSSEGKQDQEQNIESAETEPPEIKKVIPTDYVLEGSLTIDINIQDPAAPDQAVKNDEL